MNLSEVLKLYKSSDVENFIENHFTIKYLEKNINYNDVGDCWKVLGDNPSNVSNINLLTKGEKGIIERLTNGIDAVIEKQKLMHNIKDTNLSLKIIEKAFPNFYNSYQKIVSEKDINMQNEAKDIDGMVQLIANDGTNISKPTFDIIDKGIGVDKDEFENTLLSLNNGNKLSRDKEYLIGAFGQGGSTSLPFAKYTLIISKKDGNYSMTIITSINVRDYKNAPYFYLVKDDKPISLIDDFDVKDSYLSEFTNEESGTLIRMIDTDISPEFRKNDITKPASFIDYINTELFNVKIPIKLTENRKNFSLNEKLQKRNAFGSFMKLKTHKKYVKKDYSGEIDFNFKNKPYNIDYFVILPTKEEDWGSDSKAQDVMKQFNIYCNPMIFVVNGQTITTQSFQKIKNKGLDYLKYRLLIVVNLDVLGNDKYNFFTSDRSKIKENEDTKGLIDAILEKICKLPDLIDINNIIAEKSFSQEIDKDVLDSISEKVKGTYLSFLNSSKTFKNKPNNRNENKESHTNTNKEVEYFDFIKSLSLSPQDKEFYSDEILEFVLSTRANKYINKSKKIDFFVNNKNLNSLTPVFMNGRNNYTLKSGVLEVGNYTMYASYFDEKTFNEIKSNEINFKILDAKKPVSEKNFKENNLDLEIKIVVDSELIIDLVKMEKKILIKICLEHEIIKKEVFNGFSDSTKLNEFKNFIIEPISLFILYLNESYEHLEVEEKNKIISSFIKASYKSK